MWPHIFESFGESSVNHQNIVSCVQPAPESITVSCGLLVLFRLNNGKRESIMTASTKLAEKRKDHAAALQKAEKLAKEIAALEEKEAQATVSLSSQEDNGKSSKKKKTKAVVETKKKVDSSSSSSSSSDSSSDDDSSDEESTKKTSITKKVDPPVKKVPAKKIESSSDSSSSSSSSSDNDSDAEPVKTAVVKVKETKVTAATKTKKDDSSSDSDSSSSSDSDSSDDDGDDDAKMKDATPSTPQKRSAPAPADDSNKRATGGLTKLYVRGLPWKATEDEVREFFGGNSVVVSCELPLDDSGRSSGTAIVECSDAAAASNALETLNGADFQGRWLSIKHHTPMENGGNNHTPRTEKQPGCKTVFVGNLSFQIDEESLREAFSSCGEILSIRFATDRETGEFKGFGHVEFMDTEATDAAVALAGTYVMGRAVRVDYAQERGRTPGSGGRGGGGGGGRGYMGSSGGRGGGGRGYGGRSGGHGGGGGRGRGPPRSGGSKKSGAIAEFKGSKITFD